MTALAKTAAIVKDRPVLSSEKTFIWIMTARVQVQKKIISGREPQWFGAKTDRLMASSKVTVALTWRVPAERREKLVAEAGNS
jgi:hypothetical protein